MGSYLVEVLNRYRDSKVCSREVASNMVRASTRVPAGGLGSMHLQTLTTNLRLHRSHLPICPHLSD